MKHQPVTTSDANFFLHTLSLHNILQKKSGASDWNEYTAKHLVCAIELKSNKM